MSHNYLTTEQLAERLQYNGRTIHNKLVDPCLIGGRHYVRSFGRRKMLSIWKRFTKLTLEINKTCWSSFSLFIVWGSVRDVLKDVFYSTPKIGTQPIHCIQLNSHSRFFIQQSDSPSMQACCAGHISNSNFLFTH